MAMHIGNALVHIKRLAESMDDLQMAIKLSPNLKNELVNELAFENLQVSPAFLKLLEDAGFKLSE